MATIRKRGKTYQIRVSTGYDALYRQVVRTKTWKPKPGMSDKQIDKVVGGKMGKYLKRGKCAL